MLISQYGVNPSAVLVKEGIKLLGWELHSTATRCVIAQKSAVLVYIAAETWSHANLQAAGISRESFRNLWPLSRSGACNNSRTADSMWMKFYFGEGLRELPGRSMLWSQSDKCNILFTRRRYALFCRRVQCTVVCTLSREQERVLTAITPFPESARALLFQCGAMLKLDIESSLFAFIRHSKFSSRFRKIPKMRLFVMFICPSVHCEQLGSHWKEFHVKIFLISVETSEAGLESDENKGHFTWRLMIISRWTLCRMWNISQNSWRKS
jgi:hypothetical protein